MADAILRDIARIVVRRTITEPLGTAVTSSLVGLYQSAQTLTRAHSRVPMDRMRSGSLIRKCQAATHASTMAS